MKDYKLLSNPRGTRAQATQGLKFSSDVSWFEHLETKAFTFILPAIWTHLLFYPLVTYWQMKQYVKTLWWYKVYIQGDFMPEPSLNEIWL